MLRLRIPHYRNKCFFEAAGFVEGAEQCDISIGFFTVPGVGLTIEIMEYHKSQGRKKPIVFGENDVSGARHVALKVSNIEEAFAHINAQPDATLINETADCKVYQISHTEPSDFYFIDRYGLQWEFEQGHSDIGS